MRPGRARSPLRRKLKAETLKAEMGVEPRTCPSAPRGLLLISTLRFQLSALAMSSVRSVTSVAELTSCGMLDD